MPSFGYSFGFGFGFGCARVSYGVRKGQAMGTGEWGDAPSRLYVLTALTHALTKVVRLAEVLIVWENQQLPPQPPDTQDTMRSCNRALLTIQCQDETSTDGQNDLGALAAVVRRRHERLEGRSRAHEIPEDEFGVAKAAHAK